MSSVLRFLRAHVQPGYHVIRITYLLSIQLKCDTYIIWLWADMIICPVLRSQQLHFLPLGPSDQSVVLCELHGMDPGDILREAVAPGGGGTNIVQQSWQELVVKGDLRTSTQCDNNQWTTKQSRPTYVSSQKYAPLSKRPPPHRYFPPVSSVFWECLVNFWF